MEPTQLSPLNQAYIENHTKTNNPEQLQTQTALPKNGKKKLALALAALGTLAVAGVAIYKHKKTPEVQEVAAKALEDIKLLRKSGEKLDGIFSGTLKNGDKVTLEYVDGVLKKSTKEGSESFEKIYKTLDDGKKVVETTLKDGSKKTVNISELQEVAKKSQGDYKKLIQNKDNLSLENFKKQSNIKYLSEKQKQEIASIASDKENTLKEAQEKAAKEAQEKAAKEAQEKAAKEAQEKAEKEILSKIKTAEELDKMSISELNEYEKQMQHQRQLIVNKYEKGLPVTWYSDSDQKLYSELHCAACDASDRANKLEKLNTYNEVVKNLNKTTTATIADKATGKEIQIEIDKCPPKNWGTYRIEAQDEAKYYGLAEVCLPEKGAFVANLPEGYYKDSLELKFLGTSNKVKGTGTKLVQQVVDDSQKLGYEGRVWVNACPGSLPMAMSALADEKMLTSPVPFYYKCGFRFVDDDMNKLAQEGIESLKKGLEYTGPEGGNMFLPKEAIEKLIKK